MLSIFLTEELERKFQQRKNVELLFYFCSHQDERRNTATAIFRGLIYQIITKRPNLIKHVLPYVKSQKEGQKESQKKAQYSLSSFEVLWIIFRNIVQDTEPSTIFCVVDGIDECDKGSIRVLTEKLVDLLPSESPVNQ